MRRLVAALAVIACSAAYSAEIDYVITEPVGQTPADSVKTGFTRTNSNMTNINIELAGIQATLATIAGGGETVDITALLATVTSLTSQVAGLQSSVSLLQGDLSSLESTVQGLDDQLNNGASSVFAQIANLTNSVIPDLTNRIITLEGGSPGAQNVTYQEGLNGYASTLDTWLNEANPTLKYGTATEFGRLDEDSKILVKFDIFTSEGQTIVDTATIASATFSMYKYTAAAVNLTVAPIVGAWSEGNAHWTQRSNAGGDDWITAGANSTTLDYLATGDVSENDITTAAGWVTVDVTTILQAWSDGTYANEGFHVRLVDNTETQDRNFRSADYIADPTLRPKLTISYDDPP